MKPGDNKGLEMSRRQAQERQRRFQMQREEQKRRDMLRGINDKHQRRKDLQRGGLVNSRHLRFSLWQRIKNFFQKQATDEEIASARGEQDILRESKRPQKIQTAENWGEISDTLNKGK